MSVIRRKLPNNLYALRRIRGFRQKTVAHMLGHKGTDMMSCYERGSVLPTLSTAIKLSMILGAQLPELFPHLHRRIEKEVRELSESLPSGSRRPMIGRQKGDTDHDCFRKDRACA